jgi:hypothetical protein
MGDAAKEEVFVGGGVACQEDYDGFKDKEVRGQYS